MYRRPRLGPVAGLVQAKLSLILIVTEEAHGPSFAWIDKVDDIRTWQ